MCIPGEELNRGKEIGYIERIKKRIIAEKKLLRRWEMINYG